MSSVPLSLRPESALGKTKRILLQRAGGRLSRPVLAAGRLILLPSLCPAAPAWQGAPLPAATLDVAHLTNAQATASPTNPPPAKRLPGEAPTRRPPRKGNQLVVHTHT